MSNFKMMTTLTIAALFAAPAFAQDAENQDAEQVQMIETAPDAAAAHFASSDLDQDGALNADEFVTFAVMQAEAGDQDFRDLVVSGEYKAKFTAHDTDASGTLSAEELGQKGAHHDTRSDDMHSDDMTSEDMTSEDLDPDEDEMEMPEIN
ncbi:hypothetical protein GCM10011309_23250 [Litorimonas cladophorae]|uniref:EF-hand domain-containing protein n=1 Tax=Litorimonas cladophorae TaxID=1220491 RepID=A0A918KQ84_9PROT|nr:hypothetical protein [Litorimonas cladophorae]GGX72292.1 hypothetical protein GCM10011309_23250 [Litorimonas cladophorae]